MSASEGELEISRFELLRQYRIAVPMPETPESWVVSLAMDLGLSEAGGMGAAPVSSAEIQWWARGSGITLSPWEFSILRRMSRAYVSGTRSKVAPFDPKGTKAAIRAALDARERRIRD